MVRQPLKVLIPRLYFSCEPSNFFPFWKPSRGEKNSLQDFITHKQIIK